MSPRTRSRYVVKTDLPRTPTSLVGSVFAVTLCAPEYHPPAAISAMSPPVTMPTETARERPLAREGLDAELLVPVDAEEHDHEEEEDHDRARVDDDLRGRQEVRLLLDEGERDAEQRRDEADGRVHRVLRADDADRAAEDDRRRRR